jgi:hypothetical protein
VDEWRDRERLGEVFKRRAEKQAARLPQKVRAWRREASSLTAALPARRRARLGFLLHLEHRLLRRRLRVHGRALPSLRSRSGVPSRGFGQRPSDGGNPHPPKAS